MPNVVIGRDLEDLRRFGEKGTITIGKNLVGKGDDAHLTSPIKMDIMRPHCILICGKRGSGKSFTMGVVAEEIMKLKREMKEKLCVVLIDTQGIYWSMRDQNEQDVVLLDQWGLKPQGFKISLYVPKGHVTKFDKAGVMYDGVYSIQPDDLTAEDWSHALNVEPTSIVGILISKIINHLKSGYSVEDMIEQVYKEDRFDEKSKMIVEDLLMGALNWGIFSKKGLEVDEFLKPGKVSVLDVSLFGGITAGWSIRSLLVGILSKKIYEARVLSRRQEELASITGSEVEEKLPYCWLMIDEAHNFVPSGSSTAASDPLLTVVTQGRQPGVSSIFITQRPNKLHPTVVAQCDIVVAHRLTSKTDIDALRSVMQTYMLYDIGKYLNDLPRLSGTALILDDNSERLYSIRVRPRQSWHAGGSPLASEI